MDDYKQNIFFFWDKNIPDVYKNHINDMKQLWSNYKIHLIDDEFVINYYKDNDPEFVNIYNKISIGAIKADLIRLLLIVNYGGLYLDIMNYPKDTCIDMDHFFKKLDIKTTYIGSWEPKNISFQVILSRPKSRLIQDLYNLCKQNLITQYNEEVINHREKQYNAVVLTGPLLFHDIVVGRQFIDWDTYLICSEDIQENQKYFNKWDCELIDIEKYFWLWRVGFDNHHGINIDKHWSIVQCKQNLFIC